MYDKSDGGKFKRTVHTALEGTWKKLERKLPPQPTEIGDDDPTSEPKDSATTAGGTSVRGPFGGLEVAGVAGLILFVAVAVVVAMRRVRRN